MRVDLRRPLLTGSVVAKSVWSGLVVYVLVAPHYMLHGPVEATVSLTWYRLSFLGRPLVHPTLDTLTAYTVPILVALAIAFEAIVLAAYEASGRRLRPTLRGFLVSSSLVLMVASTTLEAIVRLEETVVARLARSYAYATSAGRIILGEEAVYTGLPIILLTLRLPFLIAIADTIILIAYYLLSEGTLFKGGERGETFNGTRA